MTKIILHIGDHKTGSTAIQTTLASKAYTTTGVSLLYPTAHRVSHMALARSITDKDFYHQRPGLFAEIRKEIAEKRPDVAIISTEDFEFADPMVVKDALQQFLPDYAEQVRVIAYVRPHAERIASSYAERVKLGAFSGTMAEFHAKTLAGRQFKYTPRFKDWRGEFGEAFELRPMVRALLVDGDAVADLFTFAVGAGNFTLAPGSHSNESVSLENLAILRRYQMALRGDQPKKGSFQKVLGLSLARRMIASGLRDGTKVQMDQGLARHVVGAYKADAEKLDAAFFTGTPMADALKAAPGKAVAEPQSIEAADHFTARELMLMDLWIEELASVARTEPEHWAKKVREQHRATFADPASEEDDTAPRQRPQGRQPGQRGGRKPGGRTRAQPGG